MARRLILETTFLVDLERETVSGTPGPATAFLETNANAALCLTVTTAGELACGPRVGGRDRWARLVKRFQLLEVDLDTAWRYGQTYRYLGEQGLLIGSNDLWIAATALAHGLPVVTGNEAHFRRVPGLEVVGYR